MKITTIKDTLPAEQVAPETLQKINNRDRFELPERTLSSTTKITLQPIQARSEFTDLEAEWDDFLLSTQTPSPFLSWDYIDVWWDVYGDKGFDVQLYIARDEAGKLIGAAPLMISQKGAFSGARSKFRHLSIIGGVGDLLGESLELPAIKGYEVALGEATAELIRAQLHGQWDVLYFYLVPHDSRSTNTMLRGLAKSGVGIKTVSSLPSPCTPISDTWDASYKNRSKKMKENIRKLYNNPRGQYAHDRHVVGQDIEFEPAYEELVRLAEARWENDSLAAFHTPEFVDFHWKLAPRLLAKGQLMFGLLRKENEYAGAVYDFIFNDKKWTYSMPWDPAYAKSRIGVSLNLWSVADAHDRGLKEVDFLPGESGIKDRLAKYQRTLNTYEAACPHSMGGTLFSLARGIDRMLKHKDKPSNITSHE